MTGLKQLLGSTATYTVANVINSSIPFLLLPVLTRVLTPSEYGLVTMFATVMSVFSAFTGLSVHGAVGVRYFDKEIDHPRFVGVCLAILAGSTMLALCWVWLFSMSLSNWTQVPRAWLLIAVFASAAQFIIYIRLTMWQVKHEAVRYGAFQVAQTILNLALSLLLILVIGMGWEGRALGVATAITVFGILSLYSLQRASLVNWQWDAGYARTILRFGVPLIPHTVGGMMISMSDRFIVTSLLGVKETGIYAASMQIGLVISVLADAGNKAFSPWLYRALSNNNPHSKARIIRYTYLLFLLVPLAAVLFGMTAPFILAAIVGEQFRGGSDVVLYIALGGAFGGMYYLVANYVFFAEKNERLALATLASGLVGVALSWNLVGLYGAVGAAQAYMVAQALCFLLTWLLAAKSHPMPWVMVWRDLVSFQSKSKN